MAREAHTQPMWPTARCLYNLPWAILSLISSESSFLDPSAVSRPRIPTDKPPARPHRTASSSARRQEQRNQSPNAAPREGQASCPCRSAGGPHEGALLTPSDNLRAAGRRSGGRERASRPSPTISAARRRAPPTFRAYFSGLASIPALPVSALRAIWMFLGPASLFFLSFFLALGFIRTRHMFLISVMRLDEILVRVMNCSFGRAFLVFGGQFELRTLLMEVSWFVST